MNLELETMVEREECDIRLYKCLPLSLVMLQAWFNDQHKCFELYVGTLSEDEVLHLFSNDGVLDSVKQTYKDMWRRGDFEKVALCGQGEHKHYDHLNFVDGKLRGFAYWATCVFNEVKKRGSLEALMIDLVTVEEAHATFKPWFYRGRPVRGLNAADAARILARYDYLKPESRPLLARGALRGAAILLDDQPRSWTMNRFEREYREECSRTSLETRAAEYIDNSLDFRGRFRMERGENWFCKKHKRYPK